MSAKFRLMPVVSVCLLVASAVPSQSTADDLARLIPKDVVAYFQFRNLQDGYAQLDPYFGKILGDQAGKNLKNLLTTSFETAMNAVPDGLRKQINTLLPKLDSLHLAVFELSEKRFEWIVLAGLKDGDEWKPFMDAMFEMDPSIRKPMQEYEKIGIHHARAMRAPWSFAWTKGLVMLSSDDRWIKQSISTLLGKTKGPSVLENEHFVAVHKGLDKDFAVAGFFDLGQYFQQFARDMNYQDRLHFDEWDAVLNISGLQAVTVQMSMKDGVGVLKGRATADPDCIAFRMLLQKPAEKKILKLVPQGSLFAATMTVHGAGEMWKNFKKRIIQNQGNFATRDLKDFESEYEKQKKERWGFDADTFFDACGSEVCVIVPELRADGVDRQSFFAIIYEAQKPKDVSAIMSQIVRTSTSDTYRGYTILSEKGGWFPASLATVDQFQIIAFGGPDGIRKIIDAHKDSKSLADDAVFRKAYARVEQKNSILMAVNIKGLLKLLEQELKGDLPLKLSGKVQQPWDFYVSADTETDMSFEVHGAIAPLIAVAGIPAGFLAIEDELSRERRHRHADGTDHEENAKRPSAEAAKTGETKLPEKDEDIRKFLDGFVSDLGSGKLKVREGATQSLIALGNDKRARPYVVEILKTAAKSKNPEVAGRARGIQWEIRDFSHMSEQEVESRVQGLLDKMRAFQESKGLFSDPRYKFRLQQVGLEERDGPFVDSDPAQIQLSNQLTAANREYALNAATLLLWSDRASAGALPGILKAIEKMDEGSQAVTHGDEVFKLEVVKILLKYDTEEVQQKLVSFLLRGTGYWSHYRFYSQIDDIVKRLKKSNIPTFLPSLVDQNATVRFNTQYVLEKLTEGAVKYNAFWNKERREKAVETYKKWWEVNKGK